MKNKRKIITGFLLSMLLVLITSTSTLAAQEDKIFLIGSWDGNENLLSAGVAFVVKEGSEAYVICDSSIVNDNAEAYALVDMKMEEEYPLVFAELGYWDYNVALFDFRNETPGASKIMPLSSARQNQIAELVYMNGENQAEGRGIRLTDAYTGEPENITEMSGEMVDDEPLEFSILPAAIIDEDGGFVGLYASTETLIAFTTNVDNFYGSSGSSFAETESETRSESPGRDNPAETERKTGGSFSRMFTAGAVIIIAVIIIIIVVWSQKSERKKKDSVPASKAAVQPDDIADYAPTAPYALPTPEAPPKVQPVAAGIVGVAGAMQGQSYPVGNEGITLGRDVSCSIRIPADTKGVSRIHCKLFLNGSGAVILMDCGSTYGTYLRGYGKLQPQKPHSVKKGDVFYLGSDNIGFMIQ